MLVYALAAWFNTRIPLTGVTPRPMPRNPLALLPDFWRCNTRLWRDRLGQISLATTTLFWGVSGNLRYIVLAWAAAALGYSTTQASSLVGVVAVGTAVGAVVASMRMRLDQATRVMPLGIAMGLLVIGMNFIDNVWVAAPFLVLLGGIGGFMVVPMNALLQHRGHNLMGSGRSIAVQNFNEQACILVLGALYSFSTASGSVVLCGDHRFRRGGRRLHVGHHEMAPAQRAHPSPRTGSADGNRTAGRLARVDEPPRRALRPVTPGGDAGGRRSRIHGILGSSGLRTARSAPLARFGALRKRTVERQDLACAKRRGSGPPGSGEGGRAARGPALGWLFSKPSRLTSLCCASTLYRSDSATERDR